MWQSRLESELELLLELLLVLREFVATAPSGVCSSTCSANLTFFSCRFRHRISFSSSRFRKCSFDNSVSRNLCSLIEVIISGHVNDNPGTAFLAVIRRLQSQSRMLAPDTPVRVPVPRQFYCLPDVNSSWQLLPDCRRWSLSLSPDIQLHSVHTTSRILFWNSVDAFRKNNSVWRTHHSSSIPRKILSCHFASTWTFLLDCSR